MSLNIESIARARIFPRGGGQMMTRSPVKVTVSEGRRHLARLPGDEREFNLNSSEDLSRLRDAIEQKMNEACRGKTISSEVVSVNITGPGLKRMVLVDLPGLISTETSGIVPGTKEPGSSFIITKSMGDNIQIIISEKNSKK